MDQIEFGIICVHLTALTYNSERGGYFPIQLKIIVFVLQCHTGMAAEGQRRSSTINYMVWGTI